MRLFLKHQLEFFVLFLLISLPPGAISTPEVQGDTETLSDTDANNDAATLGPNSPITDISTTVPPQLQEQPPQEILPQEQPPQAQEQPSQTHEQPSQTQEQRGHWGKAASHHNHAHIIGGTNISSVDAAKEINADDTMISELEQHVPFVPITNKQKSKSFADDGKSKPQTASSGQSGEDITITQSKVGAVGGGKSANHRISPIPPEAFTLTAHVRSNPKDRTSYFTTAANDPEGPNDELLIPFLECGALGSSTQGISVNKGFFRHFPKSAYPTEYIPTQEPHLLICLNQLEMAVNGGEHGEEKRVFEQGSVILVDDVLGGGYKLYSSDGDVSVLKLTLPTSTHHHVAGTNESMGISRRVGGRVMSLLFVRKSQRKVHGDCQLEHDPAYSALGLKPQSDVEDDDLSLVGSIKNNFPRKRRMVWSSIGVGVSSVATIFLSKVAPHLLAVGFGGACCVGCMTTGVVKAGEWLCDEAEVWMDRQQFYRTEEIANEDENEDEEERRVPSEEVISM